MNCQLPPRLVIRLAGTEEVIIKRPDSKQFVMAWCSLLSFYHFLHPPRDHWGGCYKMWIRSCLLSTLWLEVAQTKWDSVSFRLQGESASTWDSSCSPILEPAYYWDSISGSAAWDSRDLDLVGLPRCPFICADLRVAPPKDGSSTPLSNSCPSG